VEEINEVDQIFYEISFVEGKQNSIRIIKFQKVSPEIFKVKGKGLYK